METATVLKLMTAAAAMASVLMVLAGLGHEAPPTPVVPIQIAERWPEEELVAAKADRLPIQTQAPLYLPVEEPRSETMALATTADIQPHREQHRAKKQKPVDICTRHGLHKVITRGGKSWRCRR
jgi:hypothetical protein